MKNWKTRRIVLFTAMCICLNLGGKFLTVWLDLPLWGDSFGTALSACIAGPFIGAMVGLTSNLAYGFINHLSAAYSLTSIALGLIIGIAARKGMFLRFYDFMKVASLTVITGLVVSAPLNLMFDKGYIGNTWGNGIVYYLLDKEWPPALCTVMGQLALEFADKVLTIAAVYAVFLIRGQRDRHKEGRTQVKEKAAGALLILCLSCRFLPERKVQRSRIIMIMCRAFTAATTGFPAVKRMTSSRQTTESYGSEPMPGFIVTMAGSFAGLINTNL